MPNAGPGAGPSGRSYGGLVIAGWTMSRQVMPYCLRSRSAAAMALAVRQHARCQYAEELYELVGEGRNSFLRSALLGGAVTPSPAFSLFGF